MGLDMYLEAERYVSGYDFSGEEEKGHYTALREAFDAERIADAGSPSATVSFTALYWRKANAIHRWFVEHVQDGVDNCEQHYVGREQLVELRDLCRKVLDKAELVEAGTQPVMVIEDGKAEERQQPVRRVANAEEVGDLLPPIDGFFFGSTELDEWYIKDIEYTAEGIDRLLEATEGEEAASLYGWTFHYRSSW